MYDFLISVAKEQFVKDVLSLFFYSGGVIAFLKLTIWVNSQRLFSFYRIYANKDKFFNHYVFKNIELFQYKKQVSIDVLDPIKKEIVSDLFQFELLKIKQVLVMNLKRIFKKSKTDYLKTYSDFNMEFLINLFYHEYVESRDLIKIIAKEEFSKFGMPENDFNRLWRLYEEITSDYEIILYESLDRYKIQKDMHRVLWFILDDFNMYLKIIYRSIGNKFNRLNGRSFGISYKGGMIGDDASQTMYKKDQTNT